MDLNEFKKLYEHRQVVENDNEVARNPIVSVCVQTYQHLNYIEECLDGILKQQTNFNFEILLGEDASSDGTREICLDYASRNPDKIRLFLHHRENNINIGGQPTGRFILLYNLYSSNGKYIALCEGDDYWTDPLKLQKQVDFLEAHPDFGMYAHNVQITGQEFGQEINKPYHTHQNSSEILVEQLISGFRLPTNSILFRADLKAYLFKEPWMMKVRSGDKCLYLTLANMAKVYYDSTIMAAYRKHPGGVVGSYDSWDYNKHISIHQNQIFFWRSFKKYFYPKYQEAIKINIANEFSQMSLRAVNEAKYLNTVVYALNTLKYDRQSYKPLQDKLVLIVKKRYKEFYKQQYINFRIFGSKIKQGLLGFLKFK